MSQSRARSPERDLKKSETYRGHDILFSPPTRKFLVQLNWG